MRFFLALFLIILSCSSFGEDSIAPFHTDYCTNFPEGTKVEPEKWKHCCLIHDMFFWAGGSKKARNDADLELQSCVEKAGAPKQAKIMYYAVRLGSYSPIKYSSKKWNYAWLDRPSYQPLNATDLTTISNELYSGYESIPSEIKVHFINKLKSYLD